MIYLHSFAEEPNLKGGAVSHQDQISKVLVRYGCLHLSSEERPLPYHFSSFGQHWDGMCSLRPLSAHVAPFWSVVGALARALASWPSIGKLQTVIAPESPPGLAFGTVLSGELASILRKPDLLTVSAITRRTVSHGLAVELDMQKHVAGKQVLVAYSSVHVAHPVRELIYRIREMGGEVIGVATVAVNQGVDLESIDAPALARLMRFKISGLLPVDCKEVGPCALQVPLVSNPIFGGNRRQVLDFDGPKVRLKLP